MTQPNILIIMWHDLGDYLGCYGVAPSPSPNIDKLAAEGTTLDNYFCSYPVCCPSRAGMMTGLIPHANGMSGQVNRGWDMSHELTPLPQVLRDSGYATYMTSFTHESADSTWEGYQEISRAADNEKLPFVKKVFGNHSDGSSPFLLSINTHAVHRPFMDDHDEALAASIAVCTAVAVVLPSRGLQETPTIRDLSEEEDSSWAARTGFGTVLATAVVPKATANVRLVIRSFITLLLCF